MTVLLVLAVAMPPGGSPAEAEVGTSATLIVNGQAGPEPIEAVQAGTTWTFAATQLLQAIGLRVGWSSDGQQLAATGRDLRLGFTIGDPTIELNGATSTLDTAPLLQGGVAFVPLSLVQALGAEASWDPAHAVLTINAPGLSPAATLAAAAGAVDLYSSDGSLSVAAPGQALDLGDRIVTGDDGSAQLQLSDGSLIDIAPGSDLQMTQLSTGAQPGSRVGAFTLLVGRILARIFDLGDGASQLDIQTPAAVIGDRGTTFLVEVAPSGLTTASVISGRVTLFGAGGSVDLPAGQTSTVAQTGARPTAPSPSVTVPVDTWLAGAVADATLARAQENLPPQAAPESDQSLLTVVQPAIQQTLDRLGGRPYSGDATTSGGLKVRLQGGAGASATAPVVSHQGPPSGTPGSANANGDAATTEGGNTLIPGSAPSSNANAFGGAGTPGSNSSGASSGSSAAGGNNPGLASGSGSAQGSGGNGNGAGANGTGGSAGVPGRSGNTGSTGSPGNGGNAGSGANGAGGGSGGGAAHGNSSGSGGGTPASTATATASGSAGSKAGGHR